MDNFESTFDLYRQMAANIPDCSIYIFDHDFDYLLAEGEEVSKLGVTSESLIGCNFFEIWPQEVTMAMSPYYLDTLKGKRQKLEQTTEDGVFIQHFIPIFDKENQVVAGMVVSQNVSILSEVRQELNERDEELKEKQRLFETVINTVGEGIVVSNLKGEILLSNPAAHELLDMPLEGKRLKDISQNIIVRNYGSKIELHNDELPIGIALRGARLDGYNTQIEFLNKDKVMHIENSARPIKTDQKKIEGAVLVMRDVTSRRELETIIEENLTALKRKNARLEHFMTKLSFNLLGPTANLNILYSLLEKTEDVEERDSYLSKIGEVARMLQNSVGNISKGMLAYTSTQEEWGVNQFESAVEKFVSDQLHQVQEKRLTLHCNFGKASEMAYPFKHFDTIMANLLENILQLCAGKKSAVFLETFKKNEFIGLKIQSDDILHKELHDQIFLEDKPSTKFRGILMAKEQVEALGGRIKFDENQIQIIF